MALRKPAPTAAFEEPQAQAPFEPDAPVQAAAPVPATAPVQAAAPAPTQAAAQTPAPRPAPTPAPTQAASTGLRPSGASQTALAEVGQRALVERVPDREVKVIHGLKQAVPYSYGTFTEVTPTNGNFVVKETMLSLGSEILLTLLSWQDQFVAAPPTEKGQKTDPELLKFSDDGITATDGTDMSEHLKFLREAVNKDSKITHRSILVGALEAAEKSDKHNGKLVSIGLAPMAKRKFEAYMAQTMYDISMRKLTADAAKVILLKAEITKNGKGDIYTIVNFETYRE